MHPLEFYAKGLDRYEYPYNIVNKVKSKDICYIDQYEGEVFYVPRHWSHQVLNKEEVIGFAIEIENYI